MGKTSNCQSGVFVCYSSPAGHALLDACLYLPECWFDDAHAERRRKCRLPEGIELKTKPQLASQLLAELRKSRRFPGRWVTCDASFGNHEEFLASLASAHATGVPGPTVSAAIAAEIKKPRP